MAISLQEIDDTIERQSKEGEKAKIEIQHDYARVDVYFQTLNVKKIEQSPVISVCMCIFYDLKLFIIKNALKKVLVAFLNFLAG